MSTKVSKCLTIAVTALAVAFMSVAAVSVATRTDWRKKATTDFPRKKITEQTQKIQELDTETAAVEKVIVASQAAMAADVQSIVDPARGREALWEAQNLALQEQQHVLAEETEVEARKVQAKLDTLTLRRDEIVRLQTQYDDLVAQKLAALAEVKRLQDLLVQARGTLDRVERRKELLEADGAKLKPGAGYDDESKPGRPQGGS